MLKRKVSCERTLKRLSSGGWILPRAKEYNYAGQGLIIQEERASVHAIRKGVTSCKPGNTVL